MADRARREQVGDRVTYVVNRNINFTNVCTNSCSLCAFRRPLGHPEAYTLDPGEVREKTREAADLGASEVCLQGGLNPKLGLEEYLGYLEAVRDASEDIHIHAYSPAEIDHMSRKSDLTVKETVKKLKSGGLDSVPGTAAEVLVDRVRQVICPDKVNSDRWEEIVRTCHEIEIPTTSTLLYGHIETPRDVSRHLCRLRRIQEDTGGFTEFVPLALSSENTELGRKDLARNLGPEDHLRVHAAARLVLSGEIENVQASWVKLGPGLAARALEAGANDLSGTLMEENITLAAGGKIERMEPRELRDLAEGAGRVPRERTTTYDILE